MTVVLQSNALPFVANYREDSRCQDLSEELDRKYIMSGDMW